ncbi:class I SAM-dependent methyltransferase [Flavihumibacter sp. R14]|nr:class I SAM-dependent methyltransferase [Flavihumibacter soli]
MKLLNIITPLSRIANLQSLYDNISYYAKGVKIVWWVILDRSLKQHYKNISLNESKCLKIKLLMSPYANCPGGHAHRNFILDLLDNNPDQWVYNLDDDNILHPEFVSFFANDKELDDHDVALVAQLHSDGTLRLEADADNIKVYHIDTAMCLFKMKALNGGLRFVENYCGDGYFIESLHQNINNKFYIHNIPLSYYNYLTDKKYQMLNTVLGSCPVPILQEEWEFSTLLNLYKELNPEKILEIGAFYGGTLWFWLNNSSRLDKVIAIDYPIPPADERYEEMVNSKSLWNTWIRNGVTFKEINTDSTHESTVLEVSAMFPEKDIDFLFIDGGHEYGTVKSDYENYSKLVRPGGMIVFHDVVGLEDVRRYWNEIKLGKTYLEISRSEGGWGFGVIYSGV